MLKLDHPSNVNMKYSPVCFVNSMIYGGTDNLVNNLPLYIRSLAFGSETQEVFCLGH
jgi:hypothetical protein